MPVEAPSLSQTTHTASGHCPMLSPEEWGGGWKVPLVENLGSES